MRKPKPSPRGEGAREAGGCGVPSAGAVRKVRCMHHMNNLYNGKLTAISKRLRREMTKEERHLWYDFLRNIPEMVHRQKPIGPYVVDFYIASAKIVIELDGGQHFEEEGHQKDALRDQYLNTLGILVLRYSNADVWKNFRGVCTDILLQIEKRCSFRYK